MRILVVTQRFLPDLDASSNRMHTIVRELSEAGHDVFVATGVPSCPEKIGPPGDPDRHKITQSLIVGDGEHCYTILRTAYHAMSCNGKYDRLRSYLSFVRAAFRGGLKAGKIDVVLVTSPPILTAIAAILLAWFRGAKIVFDIRDLRADEIVADGGGDGEDSLYLRTIRGTERWIYRKADLVSCATQAFVETVVEQRGVDREKTILTPNGADLDIFRPLPSYNEVSRLYPFDHRFVVMCSGLPGVETILEAAKLLRDERGIVFFIRGNGPPCGAAPGERPVTGEVFENVIFGDQRPMIDLPFLIARAGVGVTSLLPAGYREKNISAEIFEYLACGKPVIAALSGGESVRVIEQSNGGVVVPPGDAGAMADAIRALYHDPERRIQMGYAGQQYVTENYSESVASARLERALRLHCELRAADRRSRRISDNNFSVGSLAVADLSND